VGNHNTGKTTTVCFNGEVESLLPYPGVRGGQFHTICSWPAILLFRLTRAKQVDERDDGAVGGNEHILRLAVILVPIVS